MDSSLKSGGDLSSISLSVLSVVSILEVDIST